MQRIGDNRVQNIIISGGRIIDPLAGRDEPGDLYIVRGQIASAPAEHWDCQIDARGCIVSPGLIDLHVSFREPGDEKDETIVSGTAAALAGGFAAVACFPDSIPAVDNRAAVEFIQLQTERATHCRILPLGAITKERAGKELAEIGQLVEAGAVAFTDGKQPVANAEIMRRALEYVRMFGRPILNLPLVPELSANGVMHEGYYSTLLGLPAIPAAAEEIMVARDIALAELTGAHVHLMCLSTAGSVELVRRAKGRGIPVTADVAVHNLLLDDSAVQSFDTNVKVLPPLRTPRDRDALLAGLQDGTIDAISSDHQPFAAEKKDIEFDAAPFGIVGLETLLPLCVTELIRTERLSWTQWIQAVAVNPARILRLPPATLRPGTPASVTVIDPQAEWEIDPQRFLSRSRNTPFAGRRVSGKAVAVVVDGVLRYSLQHDLVPAV